MSKIEDGDKKKTKKEKSREGSFSVFRKIEEEVGGGGFSFPAPLPFKRAFPNAVFCPPIATCVAAVHFFLLLL